ncbi:MAG: hypothetical protein LC687_06750, partial [Actinobacteria bacterium]|nr:hypothetical protein [Actinomycetota bacterium]
LESVRVRINGGSPSDAVVTGEDETKSWTLSVSEADFDALLEGPHTFGIEATDRVGRVDTVQRVIFKDTTGPSVSFSSITDDSSMDATILTESVPSVRGSVSDEFSDIDPDSFEYRLNYEEADENEDWIRDAAVSLSGSGKNSNWSVAVDDLADGYHTVEVRVADTLGNMSSSDVVEFGIDRQAPVVTAYAQLPGETDELASGTIFSGESVDGTVFTLSGVSDDATLTETEVRLGGLFYPVTATDGALEAPTFEWEFTVTTALFDALLEGLQSIVVFARDAAGRVTEHEWSFIKDSLAPEIEINNLELDGSTVLLESSPRILVSVSDEFGISSAESRIEQYTYGAAEWNAIPIQDWTSLGNTENKTVASFTKRLGSDGLNLGDGRYRVSIRSGDRAQPGPNTALIEELEFLIDRANPQLALGAISGFQNADFDLPGTASDPNTIVAVQGKVGDSDFSSGDVVSATSSDGFSSWSLTVPTGGLGQGSHTVYVQAEDEAGRTTTLTRGFTFDGLPPSIAINEPANDTRVNGLVTVRGTSDDDNAVALVEYRIGNNATTWQTAGLGGGLYSWNYTFNNINTYANTADVTEIDPATGDPQAGTNVWALPFQVRVTDVAGNETENLDYRLFVDPDMDAPQVTIISPTDDQIVGGAVRVSGFAWVRRVEIRIDPTGTGEELEYGPWQDATLVSQGTQVNWFYNINTAGELNPDPGTIRDVLVQVRAVDSKDFGLTDGITGDTSEVNVKFDSGVPSIEDIEIVRNGEVSPYAAGVRASGTFLVRATLKDEGGISSIRWRGEGQPYVEILNDPAITTPPVEISAGSFEVDRKYLITSIGSTDFTTIGASSNTVGISFTASGSGIGTGTAFAATGPAGQPDEQFFVYTVQLEIDSETVNGGVYAGTSGFYSMDIQATDNATPTPFLTQASLNIQIDNFFPFGEYTSSPNAATENYFIQGRATDVGAGSGSIQGIDRVVVYFFRDGNYINLNGGTFESIPRTMRNAGSPGSEETAPIEELPFPEVDGVDGIVINNNEVTSDLDGNGYVEGWTDDGPFKDWYVRFNTNQLPDGPVDLNYVVIDRAGNATRYVQPLYIRNNAPLITGVVLGTDVDGDGSVGDIATGESRQISANYADTNFTVRNYRLAFSVEAENGNELRRYSVGYVTAAPTVDPDALLRGSVYT